MQCFPDFRFQLVQLQNVLQQTNWKRLRGEEYIFSYLYTMCCEVGLKTPPTLLDKLVSNIADIVICVYS